MDSMYSAASTSSATASGSVFGPLDEILDEGDGTCPTFERLLQRAENENSELMRFLNEETRKYKALQKELEETNSQRDKLERSSNELNEEAKQIQRLVRQNKEISDSLKRTNILLHHHEGTLQKKYEKACSDLQQLKIDNTEVVKKYQSTWDRYYSFYESSKLAEQLANTKKTALDMQKKANETEGKVKQMEVELISAKKEKTNMEEKLKNDLKSSKAAIINLAEIYIQASSAVKLANDKLHQIKKLKETRSALSSAPADQLQEEQQLECEMESTESINGELQQKESSDKINKEKEDSSQETQNHQSTGILNCASEKFPHNQQFYHLLGKTQETPNKNNIEPNQKDVQDTSVRQDQQLTSQHSTLNRSVCRPTTTNNKGLGSYGGFLSAYSQNDKPLYYQSSLLSPARTNQYQLFNTFSKASKTPQHSQNLMQDSYAKLSNQNVDSEVQDGFENSYETGNKPTVMEQSKISPLQCQEQTVEESSSESNTSVKSPEPSCSRITPKTPSREPETTDLFNFTEYSERLRLINKSPGEGFSYHSRPMFEMVGNMSDDTDNATGSLGGTQTSFFQPFFTSRATEPNEQFAGKATFFSLSPKGNQERIGVQQGHQFQLEKEQTSSVSNTNNLFSTLTPGEECGTCPAAGFSLFSDQPASSLGSPGNNSPKSSTFSFNFCALPSFSAGNPTSQNGTFNLF